MKEHQWNQETGKLGKKLNKVTNNEVSSLIDLF